MTSRPEAARRAGRFPAVAAAIAIAALLFICWPLLRSPNLTLHEAWGHLFGVWLGLVVILYALARAIASPHRDDDRTRRKESGA